MKKHLWTLVAAALLISLNGHAADFGKGIWISAEEIADLPMKGNPWRLLKKDADRLRTKIAKNNKNWI